MSTSNPIIITKSSAGGGIVQRGPRIPGVLPSVRYGEQVISTGIPSLDCFIGGGIPLGSICIIKDSFPSRYGDCILKSFMAEGSIHCHNLYIASGLESSEVFINELPTPFVSKKPEAALEDHSLGLGGDPDGTLKIAWRYGHQQQSQGGGSKEITKFEFSKKTTAAELGAKSIVTSKLFEFEKCESLSSVSYRELLQEITDTVKPFEMPAAGNGAKPPSNLVRIGISHCEEQVLAPGFLPGLRALVRHTNSCALITISDVGGTPEKLFRCEHLADYMISLQAVVDEKRRTELGDIDGICDVIKIASVNSLKPVEPPRDLGFSFKKKRLLFHELHLPPEGDNTTQREVTTRHPAPQSSSGCGVTIKGKSIDF